MFIKYFLAISYALCSEPILPDTNSLNGNNIIFLANDNILEKNRTDLNICTEHLEEIKTHIQQLKLFNSVTYARKEKLLNDNSVLLEFTDPKNPYNQEKIRNILVFLNKSFCWLRTKIEPLDLGEQLKLHLIALLENTQRSIYKILVFLSCLCKNVGYYKACYKISKTATVPKKSFITDLTLFIQHLDNVIKNYRCLLKNLKYIQERLKNFIKNDKN